MNPMTFGPSFFGILIIFLYIGFLGLTIYFMISAILFFKRKIRNDEALLNKIDDLISSNKKEKE